MNLRWAHESSFLQRRLSLLMWWWLLVSQTKMTTLDVHKADGLQVWVWDRISRAQWRISRESPIRKKKMTRMCPRFPLKSSECPAAIHKRKLEEEQALEWGQEGGPWHSLALVRVRRREDAAEEMRSRRSVRGTLLRMGWGDGLWSWAMALTIMFIKHLCPNK